MPPATPSAEAPPVSRLDAIPPGAIKRTPADDSWPPGAASGWSKPVPLGAPVSTAGAEDSPFLTADGLRFYFFFTPDLQIPAEKQVGDGVTGIWVAQRAGDTWTEPTQVLLAAPNEPHLDGCPCAWNELLYFCSVRAGNLREVDMYVARRAGDAWTDIRNLGQQLNADDQMGEMHITADGRAIYFGSRRPGGLGGADLWMVEKVGDGWGAPVNLGPTVNTPGDEDRPFVSPDGKELWFDGTSRRGKPGPAVFRSVRQPDGSWGQPEEVVSCFAAEPTLTADGRTLYFVHHYFTADMSRMLEADIYVARRLQP
jgi:hypothetical protein